jgi:hypothetical protein
VSIRDRLKGVPLDAVELVEQMLQYATLFPQCVFVTIRPDTTQPAVPMRANVCPTSTSGTRRSPQQPARCPCPCLGMIRGPPAAERLLRCRRKRKAGSACKKGRSFPLQKGKQFLVGKRARSLDWSEINHAEKRARFRQKRLQIDGFTATSHVYTIFFIACDKAGGREEARREREPETCMIRDEFQGVGRGKGGG